MKRRSAALSVQKALFTLLSNGLTVPVYDAVPDNSAFPYVVLGEDTESEFGGKNLTGSELTHTLHIWSRYRGFTEAKSIMDSIVRLVTAIPLDLSAWGFYPVIAQVDMAEVWSEEDGVTRHGAVRLRIKVGDSMPEQDR
jgi:hypothetical protein